MLREIVRVAQVQELDAVLVAGDLYDSAASSAPAQKLVVRTLMALARSAARGIATPGTCGCRAHPAEHSWVVITNDHHMRTRHYEASLALEHGLMVVNIKGVGHPHSMGSASPGDR